MPVHWCHKLYDYRMEFLWTITSYPTIPTSVTYRELFGPSRRSRVTFPRSRRFSFASVGRAVTTELCWSNNDQMHTVPGTKGNDWEATERVMRRTVVKAELASRTHRGLG